MSRYNILALILKHLEYLFKYLMNKEKEKENEKQQIKK